MPQDLLVEATPCAAQRELMESHGFTLEEWTEHSGLATWQGHGIAWDIPIHKVPTPAALCSRIAQQAKLRGIETMRKTLWRLLGLREIDCPVPFELVEMDQKSGRL